MLGFLNLFWIFVCFPTLTMCTTMAPPHGNAFHLLPPPSREEFLMQKTRVEMPQNASLDFNGNGLAPLHNDDVEVTKSDLLQGQQEQQQQQQEEEDKQKGRGIVSSISQQATNFGKGLLNFFRGSPNRRGGPMPYPGPPIRRPFHPPPRGFRPHGPPMHHPMSDSLDKDRVGPSFQSEPLQGGFLPSKKVFGNLGASSGLISSSTAINVTKVVLDNPKAPCDFYTDSLCIESHPYPIESLRRAGRVDLQRLRHMMTDVKEQNADVLIDGVTVQEEVLYTFEHYYGTENNNTHSYRDYGAEGGFICPSDVRYARLKRAKSALGKWKIIVNFDDFTQTTRLEKCLKPYSRCSYVFSYLNSECVQVYNYQRLVAWDRDRGFHLDIFKVPSSCSCHLRSSSSLKSLTTTTPMTPAPAEQPAEFHQASGSSISKKVVNEESGSVMTTQATPLLTRTSQPLLPLDTSGSQGSPVQHFDFPRRRLPQMKPSRFQVSGHLPATEGPNRPNLGNRPAIHHLRIPSFRLTPLGLVNGNPENARKHPAEAEVAHSQEVDQYQMSTSAGHPRRVQEGRFARIQGNPGRPTGLNPQISRRQRGDNMAIDHRSSEMNSQSQLGNSQNNRVNYNTNPISDFMHHQWSG